VRPNFFMQMLALPPLAFEIAHSGTLSLPLDDASIAYVDANDVAAVAHRALVDKSLCGQGVKVNGPRAWNHTALTQVLSSSLGREITHVRLSEADARRLLTVRGFPGRQVERVLSFYRLIREGFCEGEDEGVATLLGRPLNTWENFVATHRAAWTPQP
jgi:uncharacterized protein YbjT (DUF2867 family)